MSLIYGNVQINQRRSYFLFFLLRFGCRPVALCRLRRAAPLRSAPDGENMEVYEILKCARRVVSEK